MRALVLERKGELALRDIQLDDGLGPEDVRIKIHTVGICGSDVHYYTHGRIGSYVVNAPMVLGHEAAGTVIEVGSEVSDLKVGDRVCMEPGVPNLASRASRLGKYNVDPAVRFWATPPIHGVLMPSVVHPAAFTFKLPDNVSFAEGAMVEPFAIGMQAALAALAGGCAKVYISDVSAEKLAIAGSYDGIVPVNIRNESLASVVARETGGWGADVVFEASGNPKAFEDLFAIVRPAGAVVLVGLPVEQVAFDVTGAIAKEARIETVFRYANVFDRALALIAAGKVDLKPLVTGTYSFEESIIAFERAAAGRPTDVKLQILLEG
jgi:D-xylulose reductase